MAETLALTINGASCTVPRGTSVAAAILAFGVSTLRRSVTNNPRGPLCGMGICFECLVTINGERHQRSCQVLCVNGMQVETDA
jgi:D-hydroxyproline dehydrogenase subunit gamma